MKKTILSAILMAGIFSMAKAQHVKLNLYGAYVFDDKINSYYSNTGYADLTIKGGSQGESVQSLWYSLRLVLN